MKYYVTMTDNFMSGWGKAQNKISKYIVECDSYQQAEMIERNARKHCEGFYTIDFSKDEFICEFNDKSHVFKLSDLPTKEEFLKIMNDE